jgi:hypothetical protein
MADEYQTETTSKFILSSIVDKRKLSHWLGRLPNDANVTFYGNGNPPQFEARWKRTL